jgi:hypothetical protein
MVVDCWGLDIHRERCVEIRVGAWLAAKRVSFGWVDVFIHGVNIIAEITQISRLDEGIGGE